MKTRNFIQQEEIASQKDILAINNNPNEQEAQTQQEECTSEEDTTQADKKTWEDDFDILLDKFIKQQLEEQLGKPYQDDDDEAEDTEVVNNYEEENPDDTNDDDGEEEEGNDEEGNDEEDDDWYDEDEEREFEEEMKQLSQEDKYEPGEFNKALEHLVGLSDLKKKLKNYESFILFNKLRMDNCLNITSTPLHAMFLGSPGTGKTTVAKLMGKMLARIGLLSHGHVVIRERSTLLGPYYSNEETNTRQAIEEAQGGILFIDEAYQLYQPEDPRDPGKFVIETLLTVLADEEKRDWMLILAGYTDQMLNMFKMNPGLKSRIPATNLYTFDDFTPKELMQIAEEYIQQNEYQLTSKARTALKKRLEYDFNHKDKNFGNARHVINLIQAEIIPAMANRVIESKATDIDSLCKIQACDIPAIKKNAEKATLTTMRPKIGFCA